MKLEHFLRHHGINGNPFSEEDAQTDTVFKRLCLATIHHPAWNKFFGSPADPSTALVFGEKGSGKTALRLQALGDGMLDASLSRRMETIRPTSEQSPLWIARQIMAINAALDWLEARIQLLDGPINIGQIAIGCALGYLDLRFAGEPWLRKRTRIAKWNTLFQERPSMIATRYDVLKGTLPAHLVKEGPSRH